MPLPLIFPAIGFGLGATIGGNSLLGAFRAAPPRTTSTNISSAVRTVALSGVAVVAIVAVLKIKQKGA